MINTMFGDLTALTINVSPS